MEKVLCNGLKAHRIQVKFWMAKQMDEANSCMKMVINTPVTSKMIRPMAMANTFTMSKTRNTQENGKMTCSMDTAGKSLVIIRFMRAPSKKVKNRVLESTCGQTAPTTREIGKTMRCADLEYSRLQTRESTPEYTKTASSMAKDCTSGLTVGHMKVTTLMIKSMALEYITGQMENNTKVIGLAVCKTV